MSGYRLYQILDDLVPGPEPLHKQAIPGASFLKSIGRSALNSARSAVGGLANRAGSAVGGLANRAGAAAGNIARGAVSPKGLALGATGLGLGAYGLGESTQGGRQAYWDRTRHQAEAAKAGVPGAVSYSSPYRWLTNPVGEFHASFRGDPGYAMPQAKAYSQPHLIPSQRIVGPDGQTTVIPATSVQTQGVRREPTWAVRAANQRAAVEAGQVAPLQASLQQQLDDLQKTRQDIAGREFSSASSMDRQALIDRAQQIADYENGLKNAPVYRDRTIREQQEARDAALAARALRESLGLDAGDDAPSVGVQLPDGWDSPLRAYQAPSPQPAPPTPPANPRGYYPNNPGHLAF